MAVVATWILMVPPALRETEEQVDRLETYMTRQFPELGFMVANRSWPSGDFAAIPIMGSVGDGEWKDRPATPSQDDYDRITEVLRGYDPSAAARLN